jgi:hypothetical protein
MPTKKTMVSAATKTKSKPKPVSLSLVEAVEELLDKITSAAAPLTLTAMSEDKLFEVYALTNLLRVYKRLTKGKVVHVPPKGGKMTDVVVALNPASANAKKFSHFDLLDQNDNAVAEAWVSLETTTLSWHLSKKKGKLPEAARHELDVAVVDPGTGLYPSFEQVQVAVTCKNVAKATKEQVREALGLRRETSLLCASSPSRAPWLVNAVPAAPASPLLLISSNPGVKKYREPVNQLGVFVYYRRFKG